LKDRLLAAPEMAQIGRCSSRMNFSTIRCCARTSRSIARWCCRWRCSLIWSTASTAGDEGGPRTPEPEGGTVDASVDRPW